ncbi:hypothetical protein BKA63DRAFT_18377 [Paraphoma chrysanthemicola]|nr:hypothetical protein BKA63DRAFT_18377 [Paraphoma chrysanthemicola]
MKTEWKNLRSDPDSIDLSEDSKEVASLYVQWLYSGFISVPPLNKDPQHGLNKRKYNKICMLLATSFVFGEKIMDIRFKNDAHEPHQYAEVRTLAAGDDDCVRRNRSWF